VTTRPEDPSPPLSASKASSYDDVPYESHGISDTHPEHLATMAELFGVAAPDPERCRFLELGCARGDNIMSMAVTLPGSSFLGVDGSARQIEDGQRRREAAGLANVRLRMADFNDLGEDLSEFDYIVCHGVYSWVSPETAQRLLRLCRRHLAPSGLVYVSYNTYPGWHWKGMLREMMAFHVRGLDDPTEKIRQARSLVEWLSRTAMEGSYRGVFEHLSEHLEGLPDHYVFHEYLEEHNHPLYFREFARRAAEAGLQYVGPARFYGEDPDVSPETAEALGGLGDRIVREQYLDILSNRTFRRSLLSATGAPARESPDADVVRRLFLSARAKPKREEPDVASDTVEEFASDTGDRIATRRPVVKAALTALARRAPDVYTFDELSDAARRLAGSAESDATGGDLAGFLLQAFRARLVDLLRRPPFFPREPTERPRASPLARIQAEKDEMVTTLQHRILHLDDLHRFVLVACDGTRDRGELIRLLTSAISRKDFSVTNAQGASLDDPATVQEFAEEVVDASLVRLAVNALFVA
jgi:methyltransferase-like protein/SAM-dependent methyltransferase